jgi:hypothetical protein
VLRFGCCFFCFVSFRVFVVVCVFRDTVNISPFVAGRPAQFSPLHLSKNGMPAGRLVQPGWCSLAGAAWLAQPRGLADATWLVQPGCYSRN